MKIAINGFGRIGRAFLRCIMQDAHAQQKIAVAAINIGPATMDLTSYLFQYDSVMGSFAGTVRQEGSTLYINNHAIALYAQKDAATLPWQELGIDWVVDCSGMYTKRQKAMEHINAGAHKVLISAPAQDEDATIIMGINEEVYESSMQVISLGSCTTNAFVPMLQVLDQAFGIESGFMTTVHAYTNTQALLDVDIGDARRSRAAALNIVPTTSGATSTLKKVMPHLMNKIDGCSLRVPVANVSLVDLSFSAQRTMSKELIHSHFEQARNGALKNIMDIATIPLVSSDFMGNSHSVIIDATLTQVTGSLGKVFGWYDNEWGYSSRLKDFLVTMG